MSKLIDLIGLTNIANDIRSWVNAHFLRKEEVPAGSTPSTTTPKMDGVASVGTDNAFARGDHRHPSDTSKQDAIADLDDIRRGAAKGDTALQSFTETDPTVPSWAKQTNKPTYTASEVGALPDSTIIPTVPTISNDIATDASSTDKTVSPKAVKDYVDAHGGGSGEENVIESISVNGTAQEITDKNVNITVPTTLASLSEDTTHRIVTDTEKETWNAKSNFSGSYNDLTNKPTLFSGDYDDLTNKPTIPAAQIQSDWSQSDNTAKDFIKNKPTIPAAQVNADWDASSGVAQILNKPTIPTVPTKLSELTDDLGSSPTHTHSQYLTSHQSLSGYAKYVLCADEAAYNAISPKQSDTLYLIPES